MYGEDVLVANKMESNGKEGMIHVSETTKKLLERSYPGWYRFEKHADVELKSLKKTYEGFLLYQDDGDDVGTLGDVA